MNNQLDPLIELQKEFCLIFLDSQNKVGLLNEINLIKLGYRSDDINMYKIEDGKFHMKRFLENLPIVSIPKIVIDEFMINPNTIVYNKIAFTPLKTPKETLNYWVPPNINPIKGRYTLIRSFLKKIICNDDENIFSYFLNFLAHMIQKPEEKPGIMIVILGEPGTGKGTFFNLLQKIWARTTLLVTDIEHVVAGFNGVLERNYIVFMDEVNLKGQNKAMEKLKSFITESTITIEQKYQPRRNLDSIHRFFAVTNRKHFGNIELDDRRFVFLHTSNKFKGNYKYFKKLYDAIDCPKEIGSLYYDLISKDISQFNVSLKPKTKELLKQKLKSLNGFSRYWYEVLNLGYLDLGDRNQSLIGWDKPFFISSISLIEHFKLFQLSSRNFESIQSDDISNGLIKWCSKSSYQRINKDGKQIRGYHLPSLKEARELFEIVIGDKINWH